MPLMNQSELIDSREACALLKVHRHTLTRMRKEGRVTGYRRKTQTGTGARSAVYYARHEIESLKPEVGDGMVEVEVVK